MKRTCLPRTLIVTLLFLFPSALAAQTTTFTSQTEWEAAICGTLVEDNIGDLVDGHVNFFGLPNGVNLGWGTLTSYGFMENSFFNLVGNNPPYGFFIGERVVSGPTVVNTYYLDLDPTLITTLGSSEGFCFTYASDVGFNIDLYDGTTLVDSLNAPTSGTAATAEFGWINVDALDFDRVEIYDPNSAGFPTFITSIDFSFGEHCLPGDSSFDELTVLQGDVADLLADASGSDAFFLGRALNLIDNMLDGSLWDDDNRLSQNGSSLFLNAAAAIIYLGRVNSHEADAVVDDLLSTLSSIVDAEIAYATANNGTPQLISLAEFFANVADSINSPAIAALVYRQAWACARAATN